MAAARAASSVVVNVLRFGVGDIGQELMAYELSFMGLVGVAEPRGPGF